MRLFIYTIFLSAFLLFQVQPMIARFILPIFGGSSSVWATCLLFFQTGLLIGYGYAHIITTKLTIQKQIRLHIILLVISLISLPIIPSQWMIAHLSSSPELSILMLLTLTVGFPYIMISSTGPLLQSWYASSFPDKSPYRLYALSNFGSLLGLFSYPTLLEPYLKINTQAWYWSGGYFLYILLSGLIVYSIWKLKAGFKVQEAVQTEKVSGVRKLLWLLLSFLGVVTLLSATNKLTNDIMVVPFLWIIPLSLYLISFIIVFDNPRWYKRIVFIPLMFIVIFLILYSQYNYSVNFVNPNMGWVVVLYSLVVFIGCTSLHGELAALKPAKGNLTMYYLIMSAGGVLGGVFVSLISPVIFNAYWEIYFAFMGSVVLIGVVLLYNSQNIQFFKTTLFRILMMVVVVSSVAVMAFSFWGEYKSYNGNVIASYRNFYGVMKVWENKQGEPDWERSLVYADVLHGLEYMQIDKSKIPLTYYGYQSGIGLAISLFPTRDDMDFKPLKVGMVGLGTGTISAYSLKNDAFTYYELNPQAEEVARGYFKFLSEAQGKTEVILGDGRISLEKELLEKGSRQFDVLAIDAFSGDVIPTHLLTREAIDIYMKHLNKEGILAFHISNKFLNLMPVMNGLSGYLKMPVYLFHQNDSSIGLEGADWVLFTNNQAFLSNPAVVRNMTEMEHQKVSPVLWTDDFAPVLPLFKWK